MKQVPNHAIDEKHFAANFKFKSHPGAVATPWMHPLPTPKTFDMLCREVKANVDNLAPHAEAYERNIKKLNTTFMGEVVYSFILPNGKELILGT
jgi:hypothetical protein